VKHIKVYLAGAYSAPTEEERVKHVETCMDAAFALLVLGYFPLIPLLTHYLDKYWMEKYGIDIGHDNWLKYDQPWLEASDVMFVVKDGDTKSKGVKAEVAHAKKMGIPVFKDINKLDKWRKEHEKRR